jgi:hypothetical protein
MTSTEATRPADPFGVAETTSKQLQEFGERVVDSGRQVGRLVLDGYEQAVTSLVEFEKNAADAAPVEWIKEALNAHASLISDVNSAYLKIAREALSN